MKKIENLRLIYDPNSNTFTEAYALMNEIPYHLNNDEEIRSVIDDFKKQKGVRSLKEVSSDYALAYATNSEAINDFENEYSVYTDDLVTSLSLKRNNPYDGKMVTIGNKKKVAKAVVIGTAIVSCCLIAGCAYFKNKAKEAEIPAVEVVNEIEQSVIEKKVMDEKINPTSWEEYVTNYADSSQKSMLTEVMNDITSNIVNVNVNNVDYKLALSPAEMIAMNYYYNTFSMSNEDMLKVYGNYNLDNEHGEDLVNDVHDGLNKMRISLIKAKSTNDVLKFDFEDQETQRLFDKYANLMVNYNNSTNKSAAKVEIEEALRADFIDNGSVMINEHPSATAILQLIPSAMNLELNPLDEKLNIILVGTETNYKVSGVENSVQQNGLVDSSCSVIDRRLDKFDEYREELQLEMNADNQYNEMLYVSVMGNADLTQEYYDSQYKVSEYIELTKDTYGLSDVMIPIMDEYLSMDYDIAFSMNYDEINEEIHKGIVAEIQAKQLNNTQPFNPKTNPTGGKKGDVFVGETQKGVVIDPSKLTEEQKKEAQKNSKDSDLIDDGNKEEEVKKDYAALCKEAYEVGQKETIENGKNAAINKKYAEHEAEVVRNAYYEGRKNGIKVWEELHAKNDEQKPIDDGTGKHEDNPNQPGGNTNTGSGDGQNNTNQPGGSNSETIIIDGGMQDVIPGTETTDPTGVEDLSQFGDVQSYSINAVVDYLANQSLLEQYSEEQGRQR